MLFYCLAFVLIVHSTLVPAKPTSFLQDIYYGSLTDIIMAIWLNASLSYIVFPFHSPSEPSENFREILQNVAKPHGVSNMRKLGHLNNFIKVTLSSSDNFASFKDSFASLKCCETCSFLRGFTWFRSLTRLISCSSSVVSPLTSP